MDNQQTIKETLLDILKKIDNLETLYLQKVDKSDRISWACGQEINHFKRHIDEIILTYLKEGK